MLSLHLGRQAYGGHDSWETEAGTVADLDVQQLQQAASADVVLLDVIYEVVHRRQQDLHW